jgi:hypothetical protein
MQILEIFSSKLPVGENLVIKKSRFESNSKQKNDKRISIVSVVLQQF